MAAAIHVHGLNKTFARCPALRQVNLSVHRGEMVALIGASGSGKSTLLRHIAGLTIADRDGGSVDVLGRRIQERGRLARNIRGVRARIGFIHQQFNLVGRLPVLTNVLAGTLGRLPSWRTLPGFFTRAEKGEAMAALDRVGIACCARQRASTLSGGQQQRAAIARTLVQQAEVLLADEPIASLDPESSRRVMDTLAQINREDGTTVVVSLHQVDFAIRYCRRTVALKDAEVVYDGPSAALTPSLLQDLYGSQAAEMGDLTLGANSFLGTAAPGRPDMFRPAAAWG